MYKESMKPVIVRAMGKKLKNFSTYKGYDGADLLKMTFMNDDELVAMRWWLKENKYNAVTKLNDCIELICIFESPKDENGEPEIYDLKHD